MSSALTGEKGSHLRSLGVEVIVADDGDVQTMRERVLQGPCAPELCGEGQRAVEGEVHELILG